MEGTLNRCVKSRYRETSMSGVVSMGLEIIRLGIRLQAISFNHSVRILHHLLLHPFGAPMRFVHALVPFVFPLQVGTMIQESPSQFFPTASERSGHVSRRTTTFDIVGESLKTNSSYLISSFIALFHLGLFPYYQQFLVLFAAHNENCSLVPGVVRMFYYPQI